MKPPRLNFLILGMSQSNFLNQLYGDILRHSSEFEFSVDGFYDISKGKVKTKEIYERRFTFKNQPVNKRELLQSFLAFSLTAFFYKIIYFECKRGKSLNYIFNILKKFARIRSVVHNEILKHPFDIFHYHFMTPQYVETIYFLPKKAKIICSFWGSDLLRNNGEEHFFYVNRALQRANAVTIQTPELGDILFKKFGNSLKFKTHFLRFTINTGIYEEIDNLSDDQTQLVNFKRKYKISENKIVISLGHNGFEENNHQKMIETLKYLPVSILDNCVFLLHFAYGSTDKYFHHIKKLLSETKQIHSILIEDYFDKKEIALLRKSTDIFVQMPVSDALSGAMTEVLYAGNIVVYGSWLPYKFFNDIGIKMYKVSSFENLKDKISIIIKNMEYYKNIQKNNADKIKETLFPDSTTPAWIKLFKSI